MVTRISAKIGKMPFWIKLETFDREINILFKSTSKYQKDISKQIIQMITAHYNIFTAFKYLTVLISNLKKSSPHKASNEVENGNFYILSLLVAIFVTMATVKVCLIPV